MIQSHKTTFKIVTSSKEHWLMLEHDYSAMSECVLRVMNKNDDVVLTMKIETDDIIALAHKLERLNN